MCPNLLKQNQPNHHQQQNNKPVYLKEGDFCFQKQRKRIGGSLTPLYTGTGRHFSQLLEGCQSSISHKYVTRTGLWFTADGQLPVTHLDPGSCETTWDYKNRIFYLVMVWSSNQMPVYPPYGGPVSLWSTAVKKKDWCCVLCLPHEMFPACAILNLAPTGTLRFMVGLRGWQGARMSGPLAQKDADLRMLGNFCSDPMILPE